MVHTAPQGTIFVRHCYSWALHEPGVEEPLWLKDSTVEYIQLKRAVVPRHLKALSCKRLLSAPLLHHSWITASSTISRLIRCPRAFTNSNKRTNVSSRFVWPMLSEDCSGLEHSQWLSSFGQLTGLPLRSRHTTSSCRSFRYHAPCWTVKRSQDTHARITFEPPRQGHTLLG